MIWIVYENERYFFRTWRLQCLHCRSTVQAPDGCCLCNRVVIKEGRRVSQGFEYRDVSLWTSETGNILPMHVLEHYYGLRREADEARADTEASASPRGGSNTGGVDIQNREGG
jgi:hypothetical protein